MVGSPLGSAPREPTLSRALPADALPGSGLPEDTDAEVQLRDGSWVHCQVIR
jgi:hypothetical protein